MICLSSNFLPAERGLTDTRSAQITYSQMQVETMSADSA